MPSNRTELRSLKNLISRADRILATTPALPENRTAACREVLSAALALATDLLHQSSPTMSAAILGRKGGTQTAKRGSEYFRELAAKRKTRAGGRPRKEG
jgi:hypothetical protein